MKQAKDVFLDIKKVVSREKKILEEIDSFLRSFGESRDETVIKSQVNYLEFYINQENNKIPELLEKVHLKKKLLEPAKHTEPQKDKNIGKKGFLEKINEKKGLEKLEITELEKDVVKRLNKKRKEDKAAKERGPNIYASVASRMFPELSRALVSTKSFWSMIDNLLRTNLQLIPTVYLSMVLLTTLISLCVGFMIFLFVFLFNISSTPPFITLTQDFMTKFMETFWILFLVPAGTFLFMYLYPSFERKSLENGIDIELPFATINMSAIAGSRIEPTNIFGIITSTGQYPNLKTQFTKVLNEINIYGHDLVTALRNSASSCPSKKLSELYNGLATNITSGGDLAKFFEKRSQTLLLDYRLQREKATRSAETFIDIYISVVIAAPMILMLLFVMIQISGLGISLSTTMISVAMVLGVSVINFAFLMFLRLRQTGQ